MTTPEEHTYVLNNTSLTSLWRSSFSKRPTPPQHQQEHTTQAHNGPIHHLLPMGNTPTNVITGWAYRRGNIRAGMGYRRHGWGGPRQGKRHSLPPVSSKCAVLLCLPAMPVCVHARHVCRCASFIPHHVQAVQTTPLPPCCLACLLFQSPSHRHAGVQKSQSLPSLPSKACYEIVKSPASVTSDIIRISQEV